MSTRQPEMSTSQAAGKPLLWGKPNRHLVDIFRCPLDNFERLTERAKTRNRQTQVSAKDLPFQIVEEQTDWCLIKIVDGTFGWLPTRQIRSVKKANYWDKVQYAKKNKVLPCPALDNIKIDQFLKKLGGIPYLWGGTTRAGMDCSAFVQKLFFELFEILLPRNSREQKKCGVAVHGRKKMSTRQSDLSTCPALAGLDMLLFVHKTTKRHHVGVYWNDEVWHFCLDKKGLSAEPLAEIKKRYRYLTARRIVKIKKC